MNTLHAAGDFLYWYPEAARELFSMPLLWREILGTDALGQNVGPTLFIYPILLLIGFLTTLGISFSLYTKILLFSILAVGIVSINRLLTNYKISPAGRALAAVIFLANTYFILLVDGGQLYLALAFSFLPLSFALFLELLKARRYFAKLLFVASTLFLSIADVRIVFLLLFLVFLYLPFAVREFGLRRAVLDYFSSGLLVGIVLTGFHAYWLYPLLADMGQSGSYFGRSNLSLSFASLSHTLLLLSPHWPENIFGKITEVRVEYYLLPFFVFLAPVLRQKNLGVAFWLLAALTSVFLAKGTQPPFSQAYTFLLDNIPGFSLFRDPTKFFFIIATSFSLLAAFTFDSLWSQLKKRGRILAVLALALFALVLYKPLYSGQMTGLFSPPIYEQEYLQVAEFLGKDPRFSRVLWVQKLPPLGYGSSTHPAVETIYLPGKRAFATGILGTYEVLNFLREGEYMGELLNIAGVGYIVYNPQDPRRDDLHPDNVAYHREFYQEIKNKTWVEEEITGLGIPVLKLKAPQEKFYFSPALWWVIGSDSIYGKLVSEGASFKNNSLVFVEETVGPGERLGDYQDTKIILHDKSLLDLAVSLGPVKYATYPSKVLAYDPNASGWWKREKEDFVSWKNFLREKYELDNEDFSLDGGWAVAEGELQLTIPGKTSEGDVLLARVMESAKGGKLAFYEQERLAGVIETLVEEGANVRWFEVGSLEGGKTITIRTEGDINVVNALIHLPQNEWENYKMKAKLLEEEGRVTTRPVWNTSGSTPSVEYKYLREKGYKVRVSGLARPGFLLFSQNYNSLWLQDGNPPLPVFSLISAYPINSDGEFNFTFEPQKRVNTGLLVSVATLTGLGIGLVVTRRRGRQ